MNPIKINVTFKRNRLWEVPRMKLIRVNIFRRCFTKCGVKRRLDVRT
jgi:hypothetical protein